MKRIVMGISFVLLVAAASLLLGRAQEASAPQQPPSSKGAPPANSAQITGIWRGNSVCIVANGPCHNEANVYRFSEVPGTSNRFSCTGSKVVDGKEIVIGSSEWTYDPSTHLLQTVTSSPSIRLTLDHDILDGALFLRNSTVYRHIHLKKSQD